jgi:RNA polymerase sigma factor (sigma-70 family)
MSLKLVYPLDHDPLSDEALVQRARDRDESAIRALTQRFNRRLYRIARSILRDDAEAEDVVQEAFVRAFTGLATFRGDASFNTWITRIAMNEALGCLRSRRPTVDWETYGENRRQEQVLNVPRSAVSGDPEQIMAQGEIRVVLEQAIDELPNSFRAVFVARLVEGMSVEETADLFGLKTETVKTRLHRARLLLRESLDNRLGPSLTQTFPFGDSRCAAMTDAVIRRVAGRINFREPPPACCIQSVSMDGCGPVGRAKKEVFHVSQIQRRPCRAIIAERAALAQGAAKPTDPQIAHIAYTAGVLDIEAGKQALTKSKNQEVRAFAEDMVRDHSAVNDQALALVKKLKVTPEDNDTSKGLTKQAVAERAKLAKLSGAAFDKAYVANEVAYHKAVNGALETLLIPSASNAELKSLLQTGLKVFQGHQQHAEHIAATLK